MVTDLDVVRDAADTSEVGDHCFRRGPLRAAAHGAGERDVAVLRCRLDPYRHGVAESERVVRHGGERGVVTAVAGWQCDQQVVAHVLDTGDATRHRGRRHV